MPVTESQFDREAEEWMAWIMEQPRSTQVAIHAATTAVLLETGFFTPVARLLILKAVEACARGV